MKLLKCKISIKKIVSSVKKLFVTNVCNFFISKKNNKIEIKLKFFFWNKKNPINK